MRNIILAVAASALLAAPAVARSDKAKAWGLNKVCLVTFGTPEGLASGADADVVGAQYLPLPAALNQKGDLSEIYTYGADGLNVDGVDHPNVPSDIGTQAQCAAFGATTSD